LTPFSFSLGKAVEVPPGAAEDLGDIILGNGLDIAKVTREKQAQAITQPQELTQAAQDFFDKIRTADYDAFLKPDADWQQFPIVGSYQADVSNRGRRCPTGMRTRTPLRTWPAL